MSREFDEIVAPLIEIANYKLDFALVRDYISSIDFGIFFIASSFVIVSTNPSFSVEINTTVVIIFAILMHIRLTKKETNSRKKFLKALGKNLLVISIIIFIVFYLAYLFTIGYFYFGVLVLILFPTLVVSLPFSIGYTYELKHRLLVEKLELKTDTN
ncbi:MAG: hypothetical protein ACP6IP_10435 [Candidatus Njordarchaeia archaeon]